MNLYTIEEKEAQVALAVTRALEAEHGWTGVKATITHSGDADGKRNVDTLVTGMAHTRRAANVETFLTYDPASEGASSDLAAFLVTHAVNHAEKYKDEAEPWTKAYTVYINPAMRFDPTLYDQIVGTPERIEVKPAPKHIGGDSHDTPTHTPLPAPKAPARKPAAKKPAAKPTGKKK